MKINKQFSSGTLYELAIELGPRSDKKVEGALCALWNDLVLEGCYIHRDRNKEEFKKNKAKSFKYSIVWTLIWDSNPT